MISTIISSFEISNIPSLLIISSIIYVTHFYDCYFTRPNPLPGPFPLPIIGNAYQQIRYGVDNWLLSLHKKYGDMYEIILADNTEGFAEYGLDGVGVALNNDLKSWKYNRQFFSQVIMTPSFNYQAIEWTNDLWNEMDSYLNKLGEDYELDLIKWMRRFTNEMIFKIATGTKNDAIASYYNMLINYNNNSLNKKLNESKNFIESIETYLPGIFYFFAFNKFSRNYIPFIRGKAKKLLKNKDYLFDKLYTIVKERRIEIEYTPLDQPLRV
ncbi:cytochrome P450 [Rhizophagus irregularis DAOM 181602=DAOM 197198]|nr:cytochrome P450 [Rhizophagus irregularis DAOM 181602=DAOM 197198]